MDANDNTNQVIYEIRLRARLESRWAVWFEEMQLIALDDGGTLLCGSTGEIAQVIGETLRAAGLQADVCPARQVRDLAPYEFVILGSAVRNGKLYDDAVNFARKHRRALSRLQTAYFFSGVTMNSDTPERRQTARACLEPLVQIQPPVHVGLFGGKIDPTRMAPMWRFMLSWVKEGEMAPGDHRDWDAIRNWAGEVRALLSSDQATGQHARDGSRD
jgi:menaquinone-dependent protoporphyrinogen oxidase